MVIDHQHPSLAMRRFNSQRRSRRGCRLQRFQRQRDQEGTALAGDAVYLDAALHQLDQRPAQGQAQAAATEAAGDGAVRLREALEQPGLLLGAHADAGIADADHQG